MTIGAPEILKRKNLEVPSPTSATPATPEPPPTVARVTVNLPVSCWNVVTQMAETSQISKTDYLRQAITTEAYLRKARQEGAEVFLRRPDGLVEKVVFSY